MSNKTNIEPAFKEAIINGVVIGALVAGVMIFSNNFSDVVVARTTAAAVLLRFATYMIENSEKIDAGPTAEYIGITPPKKKEVVKLGKVI